MLCFFFFKQKTADEMRISDWSSDVCSSDLASSGSDRSDGGTISKVSRLPTRTSAAVSSDSNPIGVSTLGRPVGVKAVTVPLTVPALGASAGSEERRGGKASGGTCRSRWSPEHQHQKTTNATSCKPKH